MFLIEIFRFLRQKKVYLVFIILTFFIKIWMNFPCTYRCTYTGEEIGARGSYVYFVHGYYSSNSEFDDMINFLSSSGMFNGDIDKKIIPMYFDYFERYLKLNMSIWEIHSVKGGITTYANDFFELLYRNHKVPTKIVIVAHSLGGIITREMIRNHHVKLEELGIQIVKVITLGTPHLGTEFAANPLIKSAIDIVENNWNTPISRSLAPNSEFIKNLNMNITNYMNGIVWHLIAGVTLDLISFIGQEIIYNGIPCDGFVDWKSALAIGLDIEPAIRLVLLKNHYQLINDPKNHDLYRYINSLLSGEKV